MKRLTVGFISLALLSASTTNSVLALTVKSVPAKTFITKISSRTSKVNYKVDVTVSFGRSSTHVKAPLLSSQVKIGSALCTASGKSTKCILRNLSSGKVFKVSVRSRNKNGYGPWSKALSYLAKNGSVWLIDSPSTSTTLPKIAPTTTTLPKVVSKALFDVGDAVGLFVASANSVSTFGVRAASTELVLKKITSSGAIQNVATDSSVTMRNFYIAPNDKIYALDVNWRDLQTREPKFCFILEVNKDSAEPICILKSSEEATGLRWGRDSLLNASSALQFDRNGAVYFMISPKVPGKENIRWASDTSQYVRRYLNGVSTDFGIGYIADGQPDCYGNTPAYALRDTISSFHVMDDGTLLVDQLREQRVWQCDPDSPWAGRPYTRTTDVYDPDGSFRSVVGCSYCQFDDGQRRNRIGFFLNKNSETVLANYEIINVRTGQITGRYLGDESIAPSFTTQSVGCPPSGTGISFDGPDGYFQEMVCFYGAEKWEKSFSLLGGPRFAQIRKNNESPESVRAEFAILLQVTPQPRRVASQVKKVVDALPMLDQILITGVDDAGLFSTVLYNPSNSTERILLGADLNIRVNKLSFNSKLNTIFATGERQSNGEKILAIIKMAGTGDVQIRKSEGEILNLQSFGS